VFSKLGLVSFGEVGDPFDPAIHEAVMHGESDEVTEPTCTTVMRPGYKHNDRLLRPAMVGVSDPAQRAAAEAAPEPEPADEEVAEPSE
jgi:molecular chaperone GrpE